MTPIQPARKSYFFGKGYTDLLATIRESWNRNNTSVTNFFGKASDDFKAGELKYLRGVFWGGAGCSVFLFGTLMFLAMSFVHIVFLGFFYAVFFCIFSILYLFERIVMMYYKIFLACPHCHKKYDLPAYACPSCNVRHTRLIPGPYGIFFRTCQCGEELKTSFLTGRTSYQAFCPNPDCMRAIENAETAPLCIPVIGTPDSGKSCFIYSALETVLNEIGPQQKWKVYPADEKTEHELDTLRAKVQQGHYPEKTQGFEATLFRLAIKSGMAVPRILQIYDCAGEVFSGGRNLDTHHYYGYSKGFITLIDCHSLLTLPGSGKATEAAFTRMLNSFEGNHDIAKDEVIKRPHAVILNKMDLPAVKTLLGSMDGLSREAVDKKCREFLRSNGLGHFIVLIESRFANVKFFPASTLTMVNGRLEAIGIRDVVSWLMASIDSSLRPRVGGGVGFGRMGIWFGLGSLVFAFSVGGIYWWVRTEKEFGFESSATEVAESSRSTDTILLNDSIVKTSDDTSIADSNAIRSTVFSEEDLGAVSPIDKQSSYYPNKEQFYETTKSLNIKKEINAKGLLFDGGTITVTDDGTGIVSTFNWSARFGVVRKSVKISDLDWQSIKTGPEQQGGSLDGATPVIVRLKPGRLLTTETWLPKPDDFDPSMPADKSSKESGDLVLLAGGDSKAQELVRELMKFQTSTQTNDIYHPGNSAANGQVGGATIEKREKTRYTGRVGRLDADFELDWHPDGTVSGLYWYPSRNPILQYTLKGINQAEGKLVLKEFTNEIHSASIYLVKSIDKQIITWSGTMNNTDGRVLDVSMSRSLQAPSLSPEKSVSVSSSPEAERFSTAISTVWGGLILKLSVLEGLSPWELQLLRNSVFARHGRVFGTGKLSGFFHHTRLVYKPDRSFRDDNITKTDRLNIDTIRAAEAKARRPQPDSPWNALRGFLDALASKDFIAAKKMIHPTIPLEHIVLVAGSPPLQSSTTEMPADGSSIDRLLSDDGANGESYCFMMSALWDFTLLPLQEKEGVFRNKEGSMRIEFARVSKQWHLVRIVETTP